MYKIYNTVRGKLANPKKPQPGCWIDIQAPTEEDLRELKPFFEIPEEVLISVKDTDEVPKVEEEEDFQFILIQTPLNQPNSSLGEYAVVPLGILYNRDYVITISDGKNDVMNYLRLKLKNFDNNKIINTAQKQRLIMKLMLFSSKIYLRYLKVINSGITIAQNHLEKSAQNEQITRLMDIGKSLAYFNRSLRSNNYVVEKLAKRKLFNSTEEDEELIEDVLDETKQAIETTKIYDRIVIDTTNTFSTIISNEVNRTVKTLTSITIILMIPTLVASIYGMNLSLPYQDSPHAFLIVMGILIISSILGILYFYRSKLF
ncbi:magnesium transporter CorA family protein [Patescibacteria group bacterium]|nr:magnesium transporter CorA family protein [Patescibacteria group bacterium]MBU1702816.1 magnesium transporter CorA family protein [Patescibacteria group bacterium]MBU1953791.1 magnesium transporter CorA family protein [Patescibacteria group bacterium]